MIKITDLCAKKSFLNFSSQNCFKNQNNISFRADTPNDVFQNNNKQLQQDSAIGVAAGIACAACLVGYGVIRGRRIKEAEKLLNAAIQKDVPYLQTLAQAIGKVLNKEVKAEQLTAVMGKNELMTILPTLKRKNFIGYKNILKNGAECKEFCANNVEQGIFSIDLHSHTNHSDGLADVGKLLENISIYADKLHEKTGKKFIFAITDHDSITGTQEALKLIAQNPERYKNVRFVPGVELSFVHHTDRDKFKVSEMLMHCIDPFSEKTINFINSLRNNRQKMCSDIIRDLNVGSNVKYSLNEVQGNFFDITRDFYKYNLLHRMFNYAQIKQRLSRLAMKWGKNPESIYGEIMPQWHVFQTAKTPASFEEFMIKRGVDLSGTVQKDEKIIEIFKKYAPKIKDGKIEYPSERTFDDIIQFAAQDENSILGFAHPAFLTMHYDNPKQAIANFISKANGLIKTTEAYHQSYHIPLQKSVISAENIKETNKILSKYKLFKTGGHDNHAATLL